MKAKLIATCVLVASLTLASQVRADWTETNNDGGPGALDHAATWVAAWNGAIPGPDTGWDTAANLAAAGFGSDPGWTGNVVNISDEDATAYAAANKVESFTDVKATVAVSTGDTSEEFGVLVRASNFAHGAAISAVSGYGATFSADGADAVGEPIKFSLYKISGGAIVLSDVKTPLVPSGFDDFIAYIELTAEGSEITAKLFMDKGDSSPIASASLTDASPIAGGYTGVINLDLDSAGIDAYYDTLTSEAIPEPATLSALLLGGIFVLRRRNRA